MFWELRWGGGRASGRRRSFQPRKKNIRWGWAGGRGWREGSKQDARGKSASSVPGAPRPGTFGWRLPDHLLGTSLRESLAGGGWMRSLQTWRLCDAGVGKTSLTHVESVIIERCQAACNSALSGTECRQQGSSRGERESGGLGGSQISMVQVDLRVPLRAWV